MIYSVIYITKKLEETNQLEIEVDETIMFLLKNMLINLLY